ncbi:MAG: hypothetical protein WD065_13615 [Planctomycetaceae bacterium]
MGLVFQLSQSPLLANFNTTWLLLPLAVVISLVYSASRFENATIILHRATRLFLQITGLMTAVFLVLLLLSYNL